MTKIVILLIALIFVFTLTSLGAEKSDDYATPRVKKTYQKKKPNPYKTPFLGEVKSVDIRTGKLTVSGKKGEKNFLADDSLLEGIRVGDRVFIKYIFKNGKLTAIAIRSVDDNPQHYGMHLRGEVKSVDIASGMIAIIGRKGEMTLSADKQLLSDVKSGDKVYIKYTEKDGKLTASAITQAIIVKSRTPSGDKN
jgi:Cu/Ag efflux protein CusF